MYNLGNSFYIVDRFLPEEHPTIADLDFATSWNMPENTVPVAGRPGCFEGTRSATPGGPVESRIQLFCKGFTMVDTIWKRYNITEEFDIGDTIDDFKSMQIISNYSSVNNAISELTICDGADIFRTISTDSLTTSNDITIWNKIYSNGDSDVVVINPNKSTFTINGITSDSYFAVIHQRSSGSTIARIFDFTAINAPLYTTIYSNGGQCDLQM